MKRNLSSCRHPATERRLSRGVAAPRPPAAGEGSNPGLEGVRFGAKLRHFRKVQGLTLKEAAAAVGCSESMLSKVENDQAMPSLKVLHRLAAELQTSIGELFVAPHQDAAVVMRRHERPIIRTSAIGRGAAGGVHIESLVPPTGGRLLYGSIHVVEPLGDSGGPIEHKGEEIGYVVEGEFSLTVDGKTYQLGPGDSFCFDSSLPHCYRNPGSVTTKVVWINTPPTF